MSKHTRHDDVVVPGENPSDVAGFLSLAHLYIIGSQVDGMPPQQEEAGLKGDPGPHGGLGEDHGHRLPLEGLECPVPRFQQGLDLRSAIEDLHYGALVKIADVQEVLEARLG